MPMCGTPSNKFGAIRGFHVYNKSWSPSKGEILTTSQERNNLFDKFAVSVVLGTGTVVGHLPREISQICWWFIETGGIIQVEVTNPRRQKSLVPNKGLEILCSLVLGLRIGFGI